MNVSSKISNDGEIIEYYLLPKNIFQNVKKQKIQKQEENFSKSKKLLYGDWFYSPKALPHYFIDRWINSKISSINLLTVRQ